MHQQVPLALPLKYVMTSSTLSHFHSYHYHLLHESESEVTQSCPTLHNPMDCSLPQAPQSMGFSRQEYWSGLPLPSPNENRNTSKYLGHWVEVSEVHCFRGGVKIDKDKDFPVLVCVITQLCPTLCDPVDCSLPGSSVHGIFQARVLKWGAISFSRGSSQPRDQTRVSRIASRHFYHLSYQGSCGFTQLCILS